MTFTAMQLEAEPLSTDRKRRVLIGSSGLLLMTMVVLLAGALAGHVG